MKRPGLSLLAALATLFFIPLHAAFGQLSTGLLNYWNFEGNFNDSAGAISGAASTTADNGTPSSVTIVDGGPLGKYGSFNHGQVSIPNSPDVLMAGRSLTISAWFEATALDLSWQALIAHGESTDYRIARHGSDSVMAYAGGAGDIPGGVTGPVVTDGLWHHIVAISEAGVSVRIWVDGALVETGGAPNITNNGSTQLLIGGNPDASGRNWFGFIDDVAMWSRPLTPAEISNIYTSGRAGTPLSALFVNTDTDHDGLPDTWETAHGLDPNSAVGDNGAAGDPDHDGLTNLEEFTALTDPQNPDSDGDGLNDGDEVHTAHTNPLVADTDGDGLSDGAEVHTYHSNPLSPDTDGDGLTDGLEVAGGTDPAVANTGFGFGLVAYWPMDSDYNSTVNGITATANGTNPIPLVPGKFGKAVQLDGNDQFLQVDGDENKFDFVGQSMTVSAWFTADVIDKDWQCLVAKGDAGGNWRIHRRGADLPAAMSICMGSADVPAPVFPATSTLSVGTGTFHNIVGVSQLGVGVRMYFDGQLASSAPAPAFTDSANPMKIGANPDTSPGRFWNGKIDDLAIWRRSLSDAEIALIWNGGTGTSIGDLLGPTALFQITNVNYNKATNSWTLQWNSKPGKTYSLNYSTDLADFGSDVDDGIPSGGATTSYGPFPNPSAAARLYFRVKEN